MYCFKGHHQAPRIGWALGALDLVLFTVWGGRMVGRHRSLPQGLADRPSCVVPFGCAAARALISGSIKIAGERTIVAAFAKACELIGLVVVASALLRGDGMSRSAASPLSIPNGLQEAFG
jgi:hypothetical protein